MSCSRLAISLQSRKTSIRSLWLLMIFPPLHHPTSYRVWSKFAIAGHDLVNPLHDRISFFLPWP